MKRLVLGVVMFVSLTGCKSVLVRDKNVYWNEIRFFEMALKQNSDHLKKMIQSGACECDENGKWTTSDCKKAAGNVAVVEARLDWHVAQMKYLGKFQAEAPPEEEPPIPDSSYLCPGGE